MGLLTATALTLLYLMKKYFNYEMKAMKSSFLTYVIIEILLCGFDFLFQVFYETPDGEPG